MEQNAFVLRSAPSGIDQVPEALESNQIIIGWSEVSELVDLTLDWNRFREILHSRYYADKTNFRKSGNAAGQTASSQVEGRDSMVRNNHLFAGLRARNERHG